MMKLKPTLQVSKNSDLKFCFFSSRKWYHTYVQHTHRKSNGAEQLHEHASRNVRRVNSCVHSLQAIDNFTAEYGRRCREKGSNLAAQCKLWRIHLPLAVIQPQTCSHNQERWQPSRLLRLYRRWTQLFSGWIWSKRVPLRRKHEAAKGYDGRKLR